MKIIHPPELIPCLKEKHLLLDTNVFRDAVSKPTLFNDFFNELKRNDVTLVTVDAVKFELLKGSATSIKYQERKKLIDKIIDATLPTMHQTYDLMYELIQNYGIDGAALHITDFLLGAMLMQYKPNLFLMTRDTTDFIQNIFDLPFIINIPNQKGIFTYGVYQYTK